MHRTANPENPSKTLSQAQPPALEPPPPPHPKPQSTNARKTPGTLRSERVIQGRRRVIRRRRGGGERSSERARTARGCSGVARRRRSRRNRVRSRGGERWGPCSRSLWIGAQPERRGRQAASTRPHKRIEVGIGEWRRAAAAKYYPTPCACDGGKYGFAPREGGR